MAIVNLGSAAVEAIQNLRTSGDWAQVKIGLMEQAGKMMNAAIEPGVPPDACGYARALRDLVIFIDVAENGPAAMRKAKPAPTLETLKSLNG